MAVNNISVQRQVFMMTSDEVISFNFDFTQLIPSGVTATGQSSRIVREDTGVDTSTLNLSGAAQRTVNVVKQIVFAIKPTVPYILVLSVVLSNGNVRSATINIEGFSV